MKKTLSWWFSFILVTGLTYGQANVQDNTIEPEKAAQYLGKVKTVCGVVASTKYSSRSQGRPTFINLDKSFPDHVFTIVIWGSTREKFKGKPEVIFDKKELCVTGEIKTYGGIPQIVIDNPDQILIEEKQTEPHVKSKTK